MLRGNIFVYTGDGAGKTTAALGLGLREIGHGKKVIIVQFMKGRKDIGEWKIQRRLYPEYEIHQVGREKFVDLKSPDAVDITLARKGLELVKNELSRKPDLLILDEINLAIAVGLLDIKEVLGVLKKVPRKTTVVLTGRGAPEEIIKIADIVSEMKEVKYLKKLKPKEGFHY